MHKQFRSLILVLLLTLLQQCSFAQDSSHIRIALLTCTPGEELYSTFGHSGLRVTDSSSRSDIVFNYGTFNFEDPNFYTKFIRGKLLYYVSAENFEEFKAAYFYTNRGITEQVLQLSAVEKIAIVEALYQNIKEQNKYYKYDFFFDNCTTRLRDILVKYKKNASAFHSVVPSHTRFRDAIHGYLDMNHQDWSKLGIDILLGAPTDAEMSITQAQFLPDILMKSLDSADHHQSWIMKKQVLFKPYAPAASGSPFTPLVCFTLFSLALIFLSFSNNRRIQFFISCLDGLILFLTGALGVLLIFMMTCTDHAMCRNNFNIFWALPTNLVLAFFINSKKTWVRYLTFFTIGILALTLISWTILPQQMNVALMPILILILFRAGRRLRVTA